MQQTVNRNLSRAMLGGIPGTVQLVKSYLKVVGWPQNPGLEVCVSVANILYPNLT